MNIKNKIISEHRGFTTEDVLWAVGIWSVILTMSPVIVFYMLMVAWGHYLRRHCEATGRANARPMINSAKQFISPRKGRMDCFVALLLAMTRR